MKKRERRAIAAEERDAIIAAYKAGTPATAIAAKYDRHDTVIYGVLKRAGVFSNRAEKLKLNGGSAKAAPKKSGPKKRGKRGKRGKRDVVAHANAALRLSNKHSGSVRHAVIALMKTLEHEEIHELSIDFNKNTFHVKRVLVEEGKV